jgi:hypothetical protein
MYELLDRRPAGAVVGGVDVTAEADEESAHRGDGVDDARTEVAAPGVGTRMGQEPEMGVAAQCVDCGDAPDVGRRRTDDQ